MMKHEFERLAGYEVSAEDYNKIIEPMYMATDLAKEEFAQIFKRSKSYMLKPLPHMEKMMKKIATHLEETCNRYTDYEAKEELEKLATEYKDRIGAKGYWISEEMRWSCYYPTKIEFYGETRTMKEIKLI